ncbi:MAG: hypothetical protein PVF47_06405 [Anaerolineae bacterium]
MSASAWSMAARYDLGEAILHTLVYADLFDYPLRTREIHRYLTGHTASLARVKGYLEANGGFGYLHSSPPFWFLAGREHLVDLRREREAFSQVLWRQARWYGKLIAMMPFVRLVAVTGSLAMNNASGPQDDIDLLIVATRNRVWLARGLAISIVHLARRFGVELCPNYVLAEHKLEMGEPNLYTAHELAQLVPLYGAGIYRRLLERNAWVVDFLPNALPRQGNVREAGAAARLGQRTLEAALGGRLGAVLERREQARKIPRLRQIADERGGKGTLYTPDLCKGHADDHATSIYRRYIARLAAQER